MTSHPKTLYVPAERSEQNELHTILELSFIIFVTLVAIGVTMAILALQLQKLL